MAVLLVVHDLIVLVVVLRHLVFHCVEHNLLCNLKYLGTVLVRDHPAHGVGVLVLLDAFILNKSLSCAIQSVDHADPSID